MILPIFYGYSTLHRSTAFAMASSISEPPESLNLIQNLLI